MDHSLRRVFDADAFAFWGDARAIFLDPEPNPFRRYHALLYSYEVSIAGGLTPGDYGRTLDRLDKAVENIDGRGFHVTPFEPAAKLAHAVGLETERLWIKDETGNVSGSHKARHLMGIMIWLEISRRLDLQEGPGPPLAIASCGNAALAAAEIARAAARPLDVFVPPDANPHVLSRLVELGARLETCPRRRGDPPGDPCFHRFLEAWTHGALPFTVQGKRNGLAIEGGCTLVWEMVSTLLARDRKVDHLLVQVGGGALATACMEGLRDARDLGLIADLPRVHTVQTRSAYPLRRAYDALAARILGRALSSRDLQGSDGEIFDPATDDRRALEIRDETPASKVREALEYAAPNRSLHMLPWGTAPTSIAYGILDDETYDWLAVTEGMLRTGGIPLVVSEERLAEAYRLGREHTPIRAEPTGTAGLAGLLELQQAGVIGAGETVAVLFTGVER